MQRYLLNILNLHNLVYATGRLNLCIEDRATKFVPYILGWRKYQNNDYWCCLRDQEPGAKHVWCRDNKPRRSDDVNARELAQFSFRVWLLVPRHACLD
jgi:hypothetical protein